MPELGFLTLESLPAQTSCFSLAKVYCAGTGVAWAGNAGNIAAMHVQFRLSFFACHRADKIFVHTFQSVTSVRFTA